tara:strand:+ start:523 stop:681 length:159 start_codon:yes stop_codon:yes gene_type:complete
MGIIRNYRCRLEQKSRLLGLRIVRKINRLFDRLIRTLSIELLEIRDLEEGSK